MEGEPQNTLVALSLEGVEGEVLFDQAILCPLRPVTGWQPSPSPAGAIPTCPGTIPVCGQRRSTMRATRVIDAA